MILLEELVRFGIIADVYGALLIARSVFYRNNQKIFRTSGAALGYNYAHTLEAIAGKREAIVGCFLLVGGFTMQFFGSEFGTAKIHITADLFFASVCALLTIATIKVIKIWTKKTVDKLVQVNQDLA